MSFYIFRLCNVNRGSRNDMRPQRGLAATLHHNELPIIVRLLNPHRDARLGLPMLTLSQHCSEINMDCQNLG
jgi:hypothetical protein